MSRLLSIDIEDHATPALNALIARLESREQLHRAIGKTLKRAVREHVAEYAATHHTSSKKLGAEPSNFVAMAVDSIDHTDPKADGSGVALTLQHPFFARAFGDVEISPKGQYLTIPMIAEAYNKRARTVPGLFFFKSKKTGKAYLAESNRAGSGGKSALTIWYALVEHVHQDQDRSRLPSDEEITQSALDGCANYFEARAARDAKST